MRSSASRCWAGRIKILHCALAWSRSSRGSSASRPAPCDDATLVRPRFVAGQLLSAADLEQEQDYQRARHRRHNRLLHGTGVVHGFDVSIEAGDKGGKAVVAVSPGLAIDPYGEELVLCERTTSRLSPRATAGYVTVRLSERATDATPDGEATRIEESAEVVVTKDVAPDSYRSRDSSASTTPGGSTRPSSPCEPVGSRSAMQQHPGLRAVAGRGRGPLPGRRRLRAEQAVARRHGRCACRVAVAVGRPADAARVRQPRAGGADGFAVTDRGVRVAVGRRPIALVVAPSNHGRRIRRPRRLHGDSLPHSASAELAVHPHQPARVSAAAALSCAVTPLNRVACWGSNTYGQVGDGSHADRVDPTRVHDIDDVVSVSAATGGTHACALKQDGTVACWGTNESGQLGDRTRKDRSTPVAVKGLTDVAQVQAINGATCALRTDGTVWCWGSGARGQLGTGDESDSLKPRRVQGLDGVTQIAGGPGFCALLTDQSVRCWGPWYVTNTAEKDAYRPTAIKGATDVASIAGGPFGYCVLFVDRTAGCWGGNDNGQLGDGTRKPSTSVRTVKGLTDVRQLAVLSSTACALVDGTSVRCWGDNVDGVVTEAFKPRDVLKATTVADVDGAIRLAAGDSHICALTATPRCAVGAPIATVSSAGSARPTRGARSRWPCRIAPSSSDGDRRPFLAIASVG